MSTATPSGTLTRVTLVAAHRRVDLVLPSETPLGTLLPEILRMLGYGPSDPPGAYRLSLVDGRLVEPEESLRSAGILDGALVRVDRASEAPMPPVVHDVTDEVADDLDRRRGRWGDKPRRYLMMAIVVAASCWATLLSAPAAPTVLVPVLGALVLVAGTAIALAGPRTVGTSILLAGAASVAVATPFAVTEPPLRWLVWAGLVGVTVLAVGVANGRLRAGATGAGTLFALLALWVLFSALGLPVERTAALLAIISALAVGLVPRLALVSSGLTRLDDRQVGEGSVARSAVTVAVDTAHRGLALAVVFLATSTAVAGWVLAHAGTGWTLALTCLLGVSTCLRVRAHPLTVEVVSLTAAAAVVVVALVDHWMLVVPAAWWGGVLVGLGVIATGLLSLSYRPPEHVRARLRQVGDRMEGIAVVAMVPVAVGVFGVYERLLGTF